MKSIIYYFSGTGNSMQWCPVKAIQYKKSTIKRGRYTHPEVKVGEMIR